MPTHSLRVRGILFDMDGVLISSTGADERCWLQWAKHHGMEGAFAIEATHGRRAVDTLRAIRPDLDPVPEPRRLEAYDAEDYSEFIVLPGVRALLDVLPADRWTIVTSATIPLLRGRLGHAHLPQPVAIVSSETVSEGKPHPEPYFAGARVLGLSPADCLVIEDSPAGVASGNAAGATVIAVLTSHAAHEVAAARWCVASLEDVQVSLEPDGALRVTLRTASATPPAGSR